MAARDGSGGSGESEAEYNDDHSLTALNLSDEANQETRNKYQDLLERFRAEAAGAGDGTVDVASIQGLLQETEAANTQIKRPREGHMDANLLRNLGSLTHHNIEKSNPNMVVFRPSEFAKKAVRFINGDKELDHIDGESWVTFGRSLPTGLFRPASGLESLASALSWERPPPPPRRPRDQSQKDAATAKTRPKEVSESASRDMHTDEIIRIFKILKRRFEENNCNPINYLEFVVNPRDYGITCENMFHVSFLVSEERALLEEDSEGMPVISPLGQNRIEKVPGATANQIIVSMSYSEWQDVVAAFGIERPMIPEVASRPSTSSQAKRPSAE